METKECNILYNLSNTISPQHVTILEQYFAKSDISIEISFPFRTSTSAFTIDRVNPKFRNITDVKTTSTATSDSQIANFLSEFDTSLKNLCILSLSSSDQPQQQRRDVFSPLLRILETSIQFQPFTLFERFFASLFFISLSDSIDSFSSFSSIFSQNFSLLNGYVDESTPYAVVLVLEEKNQENLVLKFKSKFEAEFTEIPFFILDELTNESISSLLYILCTEFILPATERRLSKLYKEVSSKISTTGTALKSTFSKFFSQQKPRQSHTRTTNVDEPIVLFNTNVKLHSTRIISDKFKEITGEEGMNLFKTGSLEFKTRCLIDICFFVGDIKLAYTYLNHLQKLYSFHESSINLSLQSSHSSSSPDLSSMKHAEQVDLRKQEELVLYKTSACLLMIECLEKGTAEQNKVRNIFNHLSKAMKDWLPLINAKLDRIGHELGHSRFVSISKRFQGYFLLKSTFSLLRVVQHNLPGYSNVARPQGVLRELSSLHQSLSAFFSNQAAAEVTNIGSYFLLLSGYFQALSGSVSITSLKDTNLITFVRVASSLQNFKSTTLKSSLFYFNNSAQWFELCGLNNSCFLTRNMLLEFTLDYNLNIVSTDLALNCLLFLKDKLYDANSRNISKYTISILHRSFNSSAPLSRSKTSILKNFFFSALQEVSYSDPILFTRFNPLKIKLLGHNQVNDRPNEVFLFSKERNELWFLVENSTSLETQLTKCRVRVENGDEDQLLTEEETSVQVLSHNSALIKCFLWFSVLPESNSLNFECQIGESILKMPIEFNEKTVAYYEPAAALEIVCTLPRAISVRHTIIFPGELVPFNIELSNVGAEKVNSFTIIANGFTMAHLNSESDSNLFLDINSPEWIFKMQNEGKFQAEVVLNKEIQVGETFSARFLACFCLVEQVKKISVVYAFDSVPNERTINIDLDYSFPVKKMFKANECLPLNPSSTIVKSFNLTPVNLPGFQRHKTLGTQTHDKNVNVHVETTASEQTLLLVAFVIEDESNIIPKKSQVQLLWKLEKKKPEPVKRFGLEKINLSLTNDSVFILVTKISHKSLEEGKKLLSMVNLTVYRTSKDIVVAGIKVDRLTRNGARFECKLHGATTFNSTFLRASQNFTVLVESKETIQNCELIAHIQMKEISKRKGRTFKKTIYLQ
eukprot:snap_masked-scaffold_3-processed-gene-5.35-mRNA-1 protein AED:1.00 eAED:1.00 QI:0/0/0/0/1/1/2/0/1148